MRIKLPILFFENEHYQAITGANGLMSNLLNIWVELIKNSPEGLNINPKMVS